mmetsp:Transcript_20452/g.52551  ORF Transcript_20452/g.52551 Transcript_20452/m.52551 type:complete len:228 (+) Transcript_20452:182-865(+)
MASPMRRFHVSDAVRIACAVSFSAMSAASTFTLTAKLLFRLPAKHECCLTAPKNEAFLAGATPPSPPLDIVCAVVEGEPPFPGGAGGQEMVPRPLGLASRALSRGASDRICATTAMLGPGDECARVAGTLTATSLERVEEEAPCSGGGGEAGGETAEVTDAIEVKPQGSDSFGVAVLTLDARCHNTIFERRLWAALLLNALPARRAARKRRNARCSLITACCPRCRL